MSAKKIKFNFRRKYVTFREIEQIRCDILKYDNDGFKEFYLQLLREIKDAVIKEDIKYLKELCRLVFVANSIKTKCVLSMYRDDSDCCIQNSNLVILTCKLNKTDVLGSVLSDYVMFNTTFNENNCVLPFHKDDENHNAFYYTMRTNNINMTDILLQNWPKSLPVEVVLDLTSKATTCSGSNKQQEMSESNKEDINSLKEDVKNEIDDGKDRSETVKEGSSSEIEIHIKDERSKTVEAKESSETGEEDKKDNEGESSVTVEEERSSDEIRDVVLDLERALIEAHEELKLRYVPVTTEVQFYVENNLLGFYISKNTPDNSTDPSTLCSYGDRIKLLNRIVDTMTQSDNCDVDEQFLYKIYFIVKNIYILKSQMSWTCNVLPWDEMEFCLVLFHTASTNLEMNNLFYLTIFSKRKIINYLTIFMQKLNIEKDNTDNVIDTNMNRRKIVDKITKVYPEFGEFFKDYDNVRNVFYLDEILMYVEYSLITTSENIQSRLIVVRSLCIINMYLDTAVKCPKLTVEMSKLLLYSMSIKLRDFVMKMHTLTINERIDLEDNRSIINQNEFSIEVKRFRDMLVSIIYDNKNRIIHTILEKLIESKTMEYPKEVSRAIQGVNIQEFPHKPKFIKIDEIKKLIEELNRLVGHPTIKEMDNFKNIHDIMKSTEVQCLNDQDMYVSVFCLLQNVCDNLNDERVGSSDLTFMKSSISGILGQYDLKQKSLEETLIVIHPLVLEILQSCRPRLPACKMAKGLEIVIKIAFGNALGAENIAWLEQLEEKLFSRMSNRVQENQSLDVNVVLNKRLDMLGIVLRKYLNEDESRFDYITYRLDVVIELAVELLLIDIFSLRYNNTLDDDTLYLDENITLFTGKNLHNYLLHKGVMQKICFTDPVMAIPLNALTMRDHCNYTTHCKKTFSEIEDKLEKSLKVFENQKEMFKALATGNMEDLEECIQNGAEILSRNKNCLNALHYAAKGPSLQVVKFVIDKGVLYEKDIYGQNALHFAARFGRDTTVEYLIKFKGFNVNELDNINRTPIHIAAMNGHKTVVQILLDNKAKTDVVSKAGYAPLHYAVKYNYIDILKLLLYKEINVDSTRVSGGYTLLHLAAENGFLEMVKFLLQRKADVDAKNDTNGTPILAAALNGHFEIVETLISNGANVNACLKDGNTALIYASKNGHEAMVKLLLSYYANVDATYDKLGYTPLHYASQGGFVEIVQYLLKCNTDVNVKSKDDETPLMLAASKGHIEIVKLLLSKHAFIDAKDLTKQTALHMSASSGHKDIVKLLLEQGAKTNVKNTNGYSPFHSAVSSGDTEVVRIFLQKGVEANYLESDGSTPLHIAVKNGFRSVAEYLLDRGAHVNFKDKYGLSPLHVATRNMENEENINILLDRGAEIDMSNTVGYTPLYCAALHGNVRAAEILISRGANVDSRDETGHTPLFVAICVNRLDIVRILLEHGADVNTSTNAGIRPIGMAIQYNYLNIVSILIKKGADVNVADSQPLRLAVSLGFKNIVKMLLQLNNIIIKPTFLHTAAKFGFSTVTEVLLDKGIDINTIAPTGPPLLEAIRGNHSGVVMLLLRRGANPNWVSPEGETILHTAVVLNDANIVDNLLIYGADTLPKDSQNKTAFELSIAKSSVDVVDKFFKHGRANVNMKFDNGWTPLHIASNRGDVAMIRYLMRAGFDMAAEDDNGFKPAHIAVKSGHLNVVEFFHTRGFSITNIETSFGSLLHCAVAGGSVVLIQYLIDQGADINSKDLDGLTPLHVGARSGINSYDVVKELLKNGAIFDILDDDGLKPVDKVKNFDVFKLLSSTELLFKAVENESFVDVQQHLKNGAHVNAWNIDRMTSLHIAACKGNHKIVGTLLRNKANPNIIGKGKSRPIHFAVKHGFFAITTLLLSFGAMYAIPDVDEKTPLDYATDIAIKNLLSFIDNTFFNIKNKEAKVINVLRSIKEETKLRAIMNAHNNDNKSIIVVAINTNFPQLEELKRVPMKNIVMQLAISDVMVHQENYIEALRTLKITLEEAKHILEAVNPIVLHLRSRIAKVMYDQSKFTEALDIYEEIHPILFETLGPNNKDTLESRSGIALIYHRIGRNAEALDIFQDIYDIQKEIFGLKHHDTINTLNYLATVLDALGRYKEALNIYKKIYEKRKDIDGPLHPLTLTTQNNIGLIYFNQNKLDDALDLFKEVHRTRTNVLGADHSDTLRSLHNAAAVLVKQCKLDEAFKVDQTVYTARMKTLGPAHRDTISSKCNMAYVLFLQGKYKSSLKLYIDSFDLIQNVLGADHPDVLHVRSQITIINMKLKLEKFEDYLEHSQQYLFNAIQNGNLQAMTKFTNTGGDLNVRDADGNTGLHFSIEQGEMSSVEYLLANGADIMRVNHKANTVLHMAVEKEDKAMVETLLIHACRTKHNDICVLLNSKTLISGATCLHIAVEKSNFGIVKLLLQFGACYNSVDKFMNTPLLYSEDPQISHILTFISCVFEAAVKGDQDIIKEFNTMSADEIEAVLYSHNEHDQTPIQAGLQEKHQDLVTQMLLLLKR